MLPFVSFYLFFFFGMVNISPWCLITSKQQLVNISRSLDHFGKRTQRQKEMNLYMCMYSMSLYIFQSILEMLIFSG